MWYNILEGQIFKYSGDYWSWDSSKQKKYASWQNGLRKYGITTDDYLSLLAKQEEACAICHKPSELLCVDHDHDSGQVRGLLCDSCNKLLGFSGDSPEVLTNAIEYLKRAVERPSDL